MKRKIYVVGSGCNCFGYSNWMNPTGFTNKIEEADLILGLGGADVSPNYYKQPNSGYLSCNPETDKIEYRDFQIAIKLKKKIIGICKSSQWGAALAGGAIFQHIDHPYIHDIETFDGKKMITNSTHHNLQDISKLKENIDYKLLAWANNISNYHINGYGMNIKCLKEPEVVFYPKISFIAFQNHNEMLFENPKFKDIIQWSQNILNDFMQDKL